MLFDDGTDLIDVGFTSNEPIRAGSYTFDFLLDTAVLASRTIEVVVPDDLGPFPARGCPPAGPG